MRLQAIKKSLSKRTALLLTVPIMMFTMLAVPAGSIGGGALGTQKAAAEDPHGDWTTQYFVTRDYLLANSCGSGCSLSYTTSYVWGSNSRYFEWKARGWVRDPNGGFNVECTEYVWIGNNYYVWGKGSSCSPIYY